MPFEETAAKAKQKVASWYAESKKLEAELAGAKAKLKALQASDKVVDKIGELPLIGDYTEIVQDKMDAYVAEAESDVATLENELLLTNSKLKSAQAAKDAVDGVNEAMGNAKKGWNEMSADAKSAVADAADNVSKSAKESSKKSAKKAK